MNSESNLDRILDAISGLTRRPKASLTPEEETTAKTFLIVGLGNPGRKYRSNRHNIGFMLVDRLAKRLEVIFTRTQSKALVTDGRYQGHKIILVKPQTYMNNSGQAVCAVVKFFKLPLENLLIAYDDVDLPLGSLRIRPTGGSAGQKGIKSIIQQLGTQNFPRLRLGIGRPPGRMDAAAYVLQDFPETDELSLLLDRAADAALTFAAEGIEAAMTRYNRAED
ncbi:MAG: aminoacyl-tRNA hydrolase [Chloroflexi bacterium]|nr:aminoacyl-tRNA hydrolase [Chloroflexota bacterium]